jgi:hypothetical protein
MNKPKKPLRGLFASTEAPVSTPTKTPIPVPRPKKDAPKAPVKSKLPPERFVPPARIKPQPPTLMMDAQEDATEELVESVAEMVVEAALVAEVNEPIVSVEVVSAPLATQVMLSTESSPVANDRIMAIQYNFEAMKSIREEWQETDYVRFLKKLDTLQTEAFLLRGKLLSEAKQRFFETNKLGWASFCDVELGMNYTTANQYIRVATEFDVTSHQRPDFGFEHFKALLPLSQEERTIILEQTESVSVKAIRTKVREIIVSKNPRGSVQNAKETSRQAMRFMRTLQSTKTDAADFVEAFQTLNPTQRMQVAATCHSAAAHLLKLARILNDEPEIEITGRLPQTRAGAVATADGFATMQEILPVTGNADHSN